MIDQTRSLGALVLHSICKNIVLANQIYDIAVDTRFHKFYGRPFERVLYLFMTRYRSVTPLGATRVNKTLVQGRCGPQPFCAQILYNPHRGRGNIYMVWLRVIQNQTKLSEDSRP